MGLHGLPGTWGRNRGRIVNRWVLACMWGMYGIWGEECVFITILQQKKNFSCVCSIHLSYLWSTRNSVHSSSSCFSFSRLLSLCADLSRCSGLSPFKEYPCISLPDIVCTQATSSSVLSAPIPTDFCSSQLHFLTRTDSSATLSQGRLWVIMERVAILKYFVKAVIWKGNFRFYIL